MGSAVSQRLQDAGVDVGNATHVVALSFPAAVAYILANASLEQFVYRPIGFRMAGIADTPGAPDVIAVKFQAWASSLVSHSTMWAMWWKFVRDNGVVIPSAGRPSVGYVDKVRRWHEIIYSPMDAPVSGVPSDREEKTAVGPYYILYFAYVWNSCYKDMIKSVGRKGGAQQMLFNIHHVLTVGLVALSIRHNTWRAGVLTRLIHDVADIVLYASKLRQALFETRGGPASVLNPWWAALLGTWVGTRILLYGHLCLEMERSWVWQQKERPEGERPPFWPTQAMMKGSWAMWILQILFFKGIFETAVNFQRTGGVIDDPFHGKTLVASRG